MLHGLWRAVALFAAGAWVAPAPAPPPQPALAPEPVAAPVPALPPAGESSGFSRFLKQQTEAARTAVRKKDFAAAEAAWTALLELDPRSVAALEGLAEVGRAQGNADGEVLARTELNEMLARAILAGDKNAEKALAKSAARLAEIDPLAGETAELLAEYSASQRELGGLYAEAGLHANALLAWQRRAALTAPGSAEAAEARDAINRLLREGGDYVGAYHDPSVLAGGHDEAWIEEHDKRTAQWSNAARWETPHYRIKTNAGWHLGSDAAAALERVHAFYREIWGIVPDPLPAQVPEGLRELSITPLQVNIYGTIDEYHTRAGQGKKDWSGGNYNGSELNTYDHGDSPGKGSRATLQTLFHEASHQFMDVAVGDVPSFVNEGIASLFEGIEILPNGNIRRDLPVNDYLTPLANKLADGTAKPLREIFNAKENAPEQYMYRWGVMYFLRMFVDEQGRYAFRDRQQDYVWDFKRGGMGDLAGHFTEFVLQEVRLPGLQTFEEFETVWRQWILDLANESKTSDKRLADFRGKGKLAGLKDDHAGALAFYEKALDIDPDDLDSVYGLAAACDELAGGEPPDVARTDRAIAGYRRFLSLAADAEARRAEAGKRLAALDPHDTEMADSRRALAGGMAGLAQKYDKAGMPRMAMRCGRKVLAVDPLEPSARALVTRLERDAGISADRWQRLFNGFDLAGWYDAGEAGAGSFAVSGDAIVNDSSKVENSDLVEEDDSSIYQTLFVDRAVSGDWSLQARIHADSGWEIAGLCFGARDGQHYQAIVLRQSGDDVNNVDFGTFAGAWTFPHTDGSVKAGYDARKGVLLRIDVRGRQVSVTVDGQPVNAIVGGKSVRSVTYPLAALRGDIGLLASKGKTRFTDIRLLAGGPR